MVKKSGSRKTREIGRDPNTGRFVPVDKARRKETTAIVETIKIGKKSKRGVAKTEISSGTNNRRDPHPPAGVIDHHPPPKKKKRKP